MRNQRLEAVSLPDYIPKSGQHNQWGFNPEEQMTRTFLGMGEDDINVHDQWACESMGAIQNRTREHLGTSDKVIIANRKTVSFEEMLEMASLGSKVLQIRSVEFAGKYKVPMRVLSSFTPWDIDIHEEAKSGTLITFEEDEKMEQAVVSGIAFNRDEAKISVLGVPDKPGIAYQILGAVADANIEVDVIIQNLSKDGKTDFSFTVHRNDFARTMDLLKDKVLPALGASEVSGDAKICKVSIVGIGMRSHVGIASKMFRSLSEEGINIQMISTSEIKTSVVIDEKYMELAVRALHKAFDLDQA